MKITKRIGMIYYFGKVLDVQWTEGPARHTPAVPPQVIDFLQFHKTNVGRMSKLSWLPHYHWKSWSIVLQLVGNWLEGCLCRRPRRKTVDLFNGSWDWDLCTAEMKSHQKHIRSSWKGFPFKRGDKRRSKLPWHKAGHDHLRLGCPGEGVW